MLKFNSHIINNNPSGNITRKEVIGSITQKSVLGNINDVYISPITAPIYSPEATALFARMTVQPSTALKELIDKTITDLKTAGIWDKTDKFHKWDLHTPQASLLDWKNSELDAEVVGTNVTFTPASGLLTSTTGHIELNYNPSTDATSFTLTDAAFSLDDVSELNISGYNFGAYNTTPNIDVILFRTFVNIDTTYFRPLLYMGNQTSFYWTNRLKGSFYTWYCEKPTTTTLAMYSDSNTYTTSTSKTFTTMINQNLVLGGHRGYTGNVNRVPINTSLFWIGGKFTNEQRAAYYTIMQYWKDNVAIAASDLYGIEMVVNGTFDTDTSWLKGAGVSIENGKAVFNNTGVGAGIIQSIGMQVGKTYRIEFTVSDYVKGYGMIYFYGSNQYGVQRLGNGRFVQHVTAAANVSSFSIISASSTFKIDNVSVKELL